MVLYGAKYRGTCAWTPWTGCRCFKVFLVWWAFLSSYIVHVCWCMFVVHVCLCMFVGVCWWGWVNVGVVG